MSTNPLERIPKRSPKTSATDLNEFAKTAGSAAASAAYPIMLGLAGEDTGDEWYEDLAYGAVPGGALVQRVKTGTKPGLLDLLPGDVGAGARLAMAPIAAAFSRDLLKGGAARLGKSARNTKKALTEKAQGGKPEIRYHRTHVDNVDDINNNGLLINPKNKGINTGDSHKLNPAVWLGLNPIQIPVLRHLMDTRPDDVVEYKVTMPKDWYINQPRYHFPGGRGRGYQTLVPPGSPRQLTDEGLYKIDQVGADIPPEFLTPFDWQKFKAEHPTSYDFGLRLNMAEDLLPHIPLSQFKNDSDIDKLPKYIRNSRGLPLHYKGREAKLEKTNRTVYDFFSRDLPISQRYINNEKDFNKALEQANNQIGRAYKGDKYGSKLYFYTPYAILKDKLNGLPLSSTEGRPILSTYYPQDFDLSELPTHNDRFYDMGDMVKPEDLGAKVKYGPKPDQIAKGAVSHGGSQDWPTLRERYFDYDKYNDAIATGESPSVAADYAAPNYKFQIDPDDVTGTRWGWYPKTGHEGPNYGMITEGVGDFYAMSRVKNLMDYARQYGLNPDRRAELHQAFKDVLKRGTIGSHAPSEDKLSEFTPGSRLPDWDLRR